MTFHGLETYVFERMRDSGLPGLSLALLRGGDVVYARGFGQRDLARGLSATPDTLYSTGSITKSVTALAVMQLAEQGKLGLDDSVARHLDLDPDHDLNPGGEPLRLRHLLTHTAGIRTSAYSESLMQHAHDLGGRFMPISGPREITALLRNAREWYSEAPGSHYAYFNEGYALLGEVVQRVSGQAYNDYVRENILLPLGMTRTTFSRDQVERDPDAAVPYVLESGEHPRPGQYLYREVRSEGGMVSSVHDLLEYVKFYLDGNPEVLSAAGVAAMMQPRVPLATQTQPSLFGSNDDPSPAAHYGYGLQVQEDFLGERLVGHGGSVLVATGYIGFLPERGMAVAVLANGSGYPMDQFGKAALAALLGEGRIDKRLEAFAWHRVESTLRDLTGHYRSLGDVWDATVRRRGDFLLLELGGSDEPVILVPERLSGDPVRFFTYAGGQRVEATFQRDTDGAGIDLRYERYRFRWSAPL